MNDMNKDELKEKVVDYASKVFFYCVKRCNSRMDAEDLSQTILLEIIQHIDKGAHSDNLDYYIWGVCKNQYNMYLRKTIKDRNNIEYKEDIDSADDSKTALDEMLEDEKIRKMNQAIKLLSKDYAEILYAYYVEDKTLKFIAEELNIPLGTVCRRLSDIRQKLKEYLDMEKLNGKKAYIPKEFEQSYMLDQTGTHNPDEEVKTLIHRNLLYHSYNNPCTIEDYSLELGIARPYIEEIVNRLTEVTLLRKVGKDKYVTDFAFLSKEVQQEIEIVKNKYLPDLYSKLKKYIINNIDKYKNYMCHSDISVGKLMWSFILYSVTFLQWRVFDQYEHTLRPGKGRWDFHMEEKYYKKANLNEISYTGFNGVGFCGWTFNADGEPEILQSDNSLNGKEVWQGIYELVKRLDKIGYYNENDLMMKELVERLKAENSLIINDNRLLIKIPIISSEDFDKLNNELKEQKEILNILKIIRKENREILEKNIPNYLFGQLDYLISTVSDFKVSLIECFTRDNLLDYEKDDDSFFFYNGIFVYHKE